MYYCSHIINFSNTSCSLLSRLLSHSCSVVVTCLILFQDEDETDSPSKFNRAEMSQRFMVQLEERVSKIIVLDTFFRDMPRTGM